MTDEDRVTEQDLSRELEAMHESSFGWALSCSGFDRTLAEEVLQIAYLKALDGRAGFGARSETKTWFFGVIRNTAHEQRRARQRRDSLATRWLRHLGAAPRVEMPDQICEFDESSRKLRELLCRLSVRQRELLHLVFYQDLTIEQSASVLGIGLGSARRHYDRGKKALRALIRQEDVAGSTPWPEASPSHSENNG